MNDKTTPDTTGEAQDGEPIDSARGWSELWSIEDWWAVWLGGTILAVSAFVVWTFRPGDFNARLAALEGQKRDFATGQRTLGEVEQSQKDLIGNLKTPFKAWIARLEKWETSPLKAVYSKGKYNSAAALCVVLFVSMMLFGAAARVMGESFARFAAGFVPLFVLACVAYVLAAQALVKWANLEYPLWALLVGLSISNTVGVPAFLKSAVKTEFYIKTGLVLLGGEVLLSQLIQLGLPGIFISWIVTPVVLVSTYVFGQRVLKMESKTLNLVISADMSVCGVSAAIATAAACRAKKEELSLAIGISLAFTVVMMIAMPWFIQAVGIPRIVGAAWIGGTIDATGAVAAAGEILGKDVLPVAATVKMIQNILIGVIAFAVAVYWVTFEDRRHGGARPSLWEIWYRFPKFILGFVLASVAFSWLYSALPGGEYVVKAVIEGCTKTVREWFFCMAFVSIGLETNFSELAGYLKGGKPLVLYVAGQAFSLILSLAMCWLMLEVVFPNAAAELAR